jgi:hypothetical protein
VGTEGELLLKDIFRALLKAGSSITIDGRSFSGTSVTINGDQVFVDGVLQDGKLVGPISISITGDVDRLDCTVGKVEVNGTVGDVKTMSGDVDCGAVTGGVTTMSGDVTCGDVAGNVKSMSGDIRMGKRS